jgi:putative ABC transport system ATP-binding protein
MQLSDLSRDETFLEKPVSDLSGGEARIVAVLRALQLKANVLLLDEPTSSLDDETARGVERLIDTWISAEPVRAYLWVTHSLHQARRVTDRVWEMHSGRLQTAS